MAWCGTRGGGGVREDSLQLKTKKEGGVLTPFISKNRLKSLFLKTEKEGGVLTPFISKNRLNSLFFKISATVTSTSIYACSLNKISIYLKNHKLDLIAQTKNFAYPSS